MKEVLDWIRSACMAVGVFVVVTLAAHHVDGALFGLFGGIGAYSADDTDGPEKRSGMALYRDYGTGCEYLASPWGGLTPRLDADGRHICNGGAQ